jgi:hypothetical protein
MACDKKQKEQNTNTMGGGAFQLAAAHFDESGPWSKAGEERLSLSASHAVCCSKAFIYGRAGIAAASPGCEVSS